MIFLLKRIDTVNYDQTIGVVVCASDEQEARTIVASEAHGGEGPAKWLDKAYTTCDRIASNHEKGVVLVSFRAG